MAQSNHPKKGSQVAVLPIMDPKDINRLKRILSDRPRDFALFTVGINTNLRASDLLRIKVGQVRYLRAGDELHHYREQKTEKNRTITINRVVYAAVQELLKGMPEALDTDFLFQSRKGRRALSVSTLNNLVKKWCRDELKLKGNFGAHTLRKTFGYQHRVQHGTDIPTLMAMFNHSSQKQTLAYLCIQPAEIKSAYLKEI